MVAHQMHDDIEHLRLDVDGHTLTAQLVLAKINFEIRKSVFHYHLKRGLSADLADLDRKQPLAEEKPTSRQEVRQA
jgi:hypothetical protein